MFFALFSLFLLCQASAEPDKVQYKCSNSGNTSMTFRPSQDGLSGRYTVELCTVRKPSGSRWTINLLNYDNLKYCTDHRRLRRPDHEHSANTLDIDGPTNCTHVCYSMNFDMIFKGCYDVKSTFSINGTSGAPYDTYHLIDNEFTKEYYARIKPHIGIVNREYEVSFSWFLGTPATDFKVELCSRRNNTPECLRMEDVTQNCTEQHVTQVLCVLSPPHGCYRVLFTHFAPWTASAIFSNQSLIHYDFCHHEAQGPHVSGSSARAWWACGAALLAGAALLGAAGLRRALRERGYHKRVLHSWRTHREAEPPAAAAGGGPVLLLYAREGERGQKAVNALKALVQQATGEQVLDLFSPELQALSAPAPGGWLRAALQRAGARVLLLQSPAAALYDAPLAADNSLRLLQPLLGARALYRAPAAGDQLLQLALRVIAEDAHAHHAYHKYYLATYSELQTEILSQVVPYRRYLLPEAAPVLLQDLAGRNPPDPQLLQDFSRAAQDMVLHVQANPDYLMDELIIM